MTRYQAYISYSHADTRFARWLQRALESWRLPGGLTASRGLRRISPVFLDRSDLRASSDLGDSLNNIIEQSAALIVVCSRRAAQSEWVNKEISYFRECHGDQRIFCIIAADNPPECFPPALLLDADGCSHEPIAGDARRGYDGRGDALLKTIAGLLDVEFDTLKRRELRRRYRRMSYLAAASVAGLVFTIALSILALDARNDANRRREQAEDLISFMLGDLRDRLEPIGRLDVMTDVGDKALEHLASLEDDELTPKTRLQRARALRLIGEVRMSQGDLDSALKAFALSNDQAARLQGSADVDAVDFELSQSHFWIGYVRYEQLEMEAARMHFERYLALSRSLVARNPDDTNYQVEIAYAHSNLGTVALKQRRFSDAESHYRETAAVNRAMLAAQPDEVQPRKDLAETLSWLGQIAHESGNVDLARDWFSQEYALRQEIVAQVTDMSQLESLANAALLLGNNELLGGDVKSAEQRFLEGFRIGQQLTLYDAENTWWRRLYIHSRIKLSLVAAAKGSPEVGLEHVDHALRDLEELDQETATFSIPQRRIIIWRALTQQARLLSQLDDVKARMVVDDALGRVTEHLDNSGSEAVYLLAWLYLLDGDLHGREGAEQQAEAAWQSGLAAFDRLPADFSIPEAMLVYSMLLDRANRLEQAAELREEFTRRGLRATEVAALNQAFMGAPAKSADL